jgi:hypothetical protein
MRTELTHVILYQVCEHCLQLSHYCGGLPCDMLTAGIILFAIVLL